MKFKITLTLDKQTLVRIIPINCQYELVLVYAIFQESIYYTTWLIEMNCQLIISWFKFFTYLKFYIPFTSQAKIDSNYIEIKSMYIVL